jgi:tetratricopeptide (TPR) repeat protein
MADTEMPDAPTPPAETPSTGKAKRAPGEASALADRRGGPGNYGGTAYQAWYGVKRIVDWLLAHWTDSTAVGFARCEARIVQNIRDEGLDEGLRVGQHGFDFALTGVPGVAPDYREVKRSPSKAEVIELLASLRHMPAATPGQLALQVGLVSESETTDYSRLVRLLALAGEATNDEELTSLVTATGEEALSAHLDAVGSASTPGRRQLLLDRMGPPELWFETPLLADIEKTTNYLAGGESAGETLRDNLFRRVVAASQARQALPLQDVRLALIEEGLMHEGPSAAALADPENDDLARLFVVLERCPVPVPKTLLARALGIEVHELDERYGANVTSGRIQVSGAAWTRATAKNKLGTQFGQPLLGAVLRELLALVEVNSDAAIGQTLNALALSELCIDSDTDTVARMFQAYDHPSKAWGDLSVVIRLAEVSMKALQELLKVTQSAAQKEDYAQVRAQTWICGHGWVYQRVDEFDHAIYYMGEAQKLAEHYDDDENRAFTLKCQGRLFRMRAEIAADDEESAELLAQSEAMLREAVDAFAVLVIDNVRKKEENHGESVSLLARTLATAGRFDEAWTAVDEAEQLLTGHERGKAYGDLQILRAELFHNDAQDEIRADERAAHVDALNELLGRHDRESHLPGAGSDRSASELAARLHRTVGLLLGPIDADAATASFRRAADIYGELKYAPGRESALWEARKMSGEVIPLGLLEALDRASSPAGVRLRAVDHAARLSTSDPEGDTMATSDDRSDEDWDQIVHKVTGDHVAAAAQWGPGRVPA